MGRRPLATGEKWDPFPNTLYPSSAYGAYGAYGYGAGYGYGAYSGYASPYYYGAGYGARYGGYYY